MKYVAQVVCGAIVIVAGLIGVTHGVEYSGWVIFIGALMVL